MREHRGSIAPRIQNGDHQTNRPARPLGHCRSLELSCPQLSLEVEERTLHLHANYSRRPVQDHVNRPPIRRRTHRNLEPNLPRGRCGGSDRLGDLQLPGVAQPDAIGRIQANDQIMATGSREPMHDVEARDRPTMLSLADEGLRDAGSLRQLGLRQTGHRPSRDQLPSKPRGQVTGARPEDEARRRHASSMAGDAQRAVIAPLPAAHPAVC
jgi:hypothetical protein